MQLPNQNSGVIRTSCNGNMSIVFEGRDNKCSDQEAIALAVKYLRKLLA